MLVTISTFISLKTATEKKKKSAEALLECRGWYYQCLAEVAIAIEVAIVAIAIKYSRHSMGGLNMYVYRQKHKFTNR